MHALPHPSAIAASAAAAAEPVLIAPPRVTAAATPVAAAFDSAIPAAHINSQPWTVDKYYYVLM